MGERCSLSILVKLGEDFESKVPNLRIRKTEKCKMVPKEVVAVGNCPSLTPIQL